MALINSRSFKGKEAPMSDKVATKPITAQNAAGQTVLLVAVGQPIPADIEERKRQIEGNHPRIQQAEDKAKRSSRERPGGARGS